MKVRDYSLTIIGLIIATVVGILSNLIDLDPFDRLADFFETMEKYELDELFIVFLIILSFFTVDLFIKQKKRKVEQEKVKVYSAMIFSSHHIINNFLNQMQLFKMTAERTSGFDPKVLALFDEIMGEASEQIQALSNVTEISEHAIKKSIAP